MDEFVEISLEFMKKEKYKPYDDDFRYLVSYLDTFSEIEWLLEELKKLKYKPTKRMLSIISNFTETSEQCLKLIPLIQDKEKPSKYMHLIYLAETREDALKYFRMAKAEGITINEVILNEACTGITDTDKLTLKSWKESWRTYSKPRFNYRNIYNLNEIDLLKLYKGQSSKKYQVVTKTYERNPIISTLAKRIAKGHCQLCECQAPFSDKNGVPYLETHHIEWLSRGGKDSIENTIALCPNCHKKMHIVDLGADVMKLKKRNKELLLFLNTALH
jgi:5-methylcytosine-specific restriction endonuclease McrA